MKSTNRTKYLYLGRFYTISEWSDILDLDFEETLLRAESHSDPEVIFLGKKFLTAKDVKEKLKQIPKSYKDIIKDSKDGEDLLDYSY